jgi:hypothetical protein
MQALKAPSAPTFVPSIAKPAIAVVQPSLPAVLRPDATAKTLQEALKKLVLTSGYFHLPKPGAGPIAIPDVPPVIKPRPYGSFPTSQPFYLPEKPPEGHLPLATQIQTRLKERPPAHDPDEVIAEDLSIRDPKEM